MEHDDCLETLIVAVSVRPVLQHLNLAVEPLGHRIADRLSNVRDDILEVSLERVGNGNELRSSRVRRPVEPAGEKGASA